MKKEHKTTFLKALGQDARKADRVPIAATVRLRRRGHHNFTVKVHDLSPEGCQLEFQERPETDESVWVKFDGLELLHGTVCWVKDRCVGIEFERPIYPAVFERIVSPHR